MNPSPHGAITLWLVRSLLLAAAGGILFAGSLEFNAAASRLRHLVSLSLETKGVLHAKTAGWIILCTVLSLTVILFLVLGGATSLFSRIPSFTW